MHNNNNNNSSSSNSNKNNLLTLTTTEADRKEPRQQQAQWDWTLVLSEGLWDRSSLKMATASHLARGITHQQRVTRLYRNSLKHLLSWCVNRKAWRTEALQLREQFEVNKYESDRRRLTFLLANAEAEFDRRRHPYPYVCKL